MNLPVPSLRSNQLYEISGRFYRYERRSREKIVFIDQDNQDPLALTPKQYAQLLEHGQLEQVVEPVAVSAMTVATVEDLKDEKIRHEVVRRLRYVRAWWDANVSTTRRHLIEAIDRVHPDIGGVRPHPSTLERWIRRWVESGFNPLALVPEKRGREKGSCRRDWRAQELFEEAFEEAYLRLDEPPVTFAYEAVKAHFEERNASLPPDQHWKVPSLASAYRLVPKIDKYEVLCARKGKKYADQKYRALLGHLAASRHNEAWEIDHTMVDCIALDDGTGYVVGRPWITVIIDRYSRMIMGIFISWASPSRYSVFEALRHAMLPKTAQRDEYPDIHNDWIAYGRPAKIVPDNAPEFQSESFVASVHAIGITDVEYTQVAVPYYKPRIERFFRTLTQSVFQRLPGSTYANIYEREGKPVPEKVAVCTISELRHEVIRWICDVYHARKHRGLGMSPMKAWEESAKLYGLIPPPSRKQIDAALGIIERRVPSNKGIEYRRVFYNSRELAAIRTLPEFDRQATFKVDPANIGAIHVLNPATNQYVRVEATDQYKPIVEGKTLAQHEMARLVVQNNPDVFTGSFRQAMAKAHAEIRAYGMKTFGKGKKERKRAVANFINGADHRRAKPVAGDTRMISEMIIDADPAELIATPAQDEPEVLPPVKKTSRKRKQAKPDDGLVIEGQAQVVEPEQASPPPSAKVAVDEDDIDLDAAARQLGMTDDSRKQED